ncbi:MAG: hypothetical protein JWM98_901, partial [Thermoleophilia bacterium]|nr:hypothetical protein [Thermoleophilia bacterium]
APAAAAHRPAAPAAHVQHATTHPTAPAASTHVTTPTAPVSTPAPQPTAAAPTSYSVTTPNGASWTSAPGEIDAVKNGVPNATITPNA